MSKGTTAADAALAAPTAMETTQPISQTLRFITPSFARCSRKWKTSIRDELKVLLWPTSHPVRSAIQFVCMLGRSRTLLGEACELRLGGCPSANARGEHDEPDRQAC